MERGCCEFTCGAPTTFQGYGIEQNRIEDKENSKLVFLISSLSGRTRTSVGMVRFAKPIQRVCGQA